MKSPFLTVYPPQRRQILTPREYLGLTPKQRANILESRIIPPRIGSRSRLAFGGIEITWRYPYTSY